MRYLSVCAGIEAATVAWHPLSWEPVAFSEIEKFPSAVLKHHYPDIPNYGDMTKHEQWPETDIDVLVGGTPCQSFSVAGLRKGMADPRGNLALVYLAIADQYRPRWLVWENVPGVLSSGEGRDFGSIIGAMVELGYSPCWRVLDASGFGIPHSRRRVFVVAHMGDWRSAFKVLFEPKCLQRDSAKNGKRQLFPCLYASMDEKWGSNQWVRSGFCVQDTGGLRRLTPREAERLLGFPDDYTKVPYCGRQSRHKATVEPEKQVQNHTGTVRQDNGKAEQPVRPMRLPNGQASGGSRPRNGQGARDSVPSLQHQTASNRGRGLDDVGLGVPVSRIVCPDGPRYKALGNSMAVPVMHWIGKRIQRV